MFVRNITKTLALIAAAAFALSTVGCGGSGNQLQNTVAVTTQDNGITLSKDMVLAGEAVTIDTKINLLSGQGSTVEVFPDEGGMLTQLSSRQYSYSTLVPGEHTITAKFTDAKGSTTVRTATVICMGKSTDEGGVAGAVTVSMASSRAAGAGAESPNTLAAPVTLQPAGGGYRLRASYGRKASAATPCAGDEFVPGDLIIKLKQAGRAAAFAAAHNRQLKASSPTGLSLMAMDTAGLSTQAALDKTREDCLALNASPDVEYADLNHIQHPQSAPNDPYYNGLWSYQLINLPAAWDITTGSSSVIVGVIDTGIVAGHADIKDKLVPGYDFIWSTSNSCDGDGYDSDPEDVADKRCKSEYLNYSATGYHGTHTSGTIGASSNNGIGIAGIDWGARIMPLRALGYYGGTDYDIMTALLYAGGITNDTDKLPATPVKIINMSLGSDPGPSCYSGYQDVFNQLYNKGIIVFVSSGNEGSSTGINPIARCNHAVAVGAVDRYGMITDYSNGGQGLDIVAPGGGSTGFNDSEGVLSTVRSESGSTETAYDYKSGTSMAAPHASGIAALMIAAYPSITPDQIVDIMSGTATDLGVTGYDTTYGAGLINAYAAVLAAKKLGSSVSTPSQPAIAVSPTVIHFEDSQTNKSAIVTNTGATGLTITSVTDSENSGGNWLSTAVTTYSDSMVINIEVNRSGMPGGTYFGEVKIVSNGGTKTIRVSAAVLAPPPAPPQGCEFPEVYLIARGYTNSGTHYAYKVMNLAGGSFSLYGLPSGTYEIAAGTDCDGNGYLCEDNIDICGAYPDYNNRAYFNVTGMQVSIDKSFTLKSMALYSQTQTAQQQMAEVNAIFANIRR